MRRWSRPWPPLPNAALAFLAVALLPGCVTRGTYDEAAGERDRLAEQNTVLERRVKDLERSSESLGSERAQLIDQMEDLRQDQADLERDVKRLRKAEAELKSNLEAREQELASRTQEVDELRGTYEGLVSDLEQEVATGQIEIQQLRDGLHVNMNQDVLFSSGSAQVNAKGRGVLGKVAARLADVPHRIVVEGHTDNVPIHSSRYPSNWELAGARAAEVVRILVAAGIDPHRLAAVSRAEYDPRASNDTPEGRARNRRIEVTLQPTPESTPASLGAAEDAATP